jgi:hypothetical protein
MTSADPRISSCRRCQHYQLQGRRGGHCQKLNVDVQGNWSACSLAMPLFSSTVDLVALDLAHLLTDAKGYERSEGIALAAEAIPEAIDSKL